MSVKIGLAPMEGVSDFPLRLCMYWASRPDFLSTPFLRLTETFPPELPVLWAPELLHPIVKEVISYRLTPQLMTPTADLFVSAVARFFAELPTLELNCGCPSKKVLGHHAGSSLLQSVDIFHGMVQSISSHLNQAQLAIKMRTGFHDDSLFTDLYQGLAGFPLVHLTIHGRTKEQWYNGLANWELIGKAAKYLPTYTIGSGDIVDVSSFLSRLDIAPDVKAVLIGRGALRNPWIFSELRNESVSISPTLVFEFLKTFALLTECYAQDSEKLLNWLGQHSYIFAKAPLDQCSEWFELNLKLASLLNASSFDKIIFSRTTLGRVKMLWGYLQDLELFSSLAHRRIALRAPTIQAFFGSLSSVNHL